ncbi:MAG: LysR family transcriptional regulator [Clostridiales Family XIII bacterium]|jgi:DNA-binding transcriptional LysR family regulator|nr:LysR family transcriptional regulator [Clostridiales Family XIII bacterium]
MNISLFKYFLVLADTLSYTKAANQLFKSESVLSRQISQLENNLGIKLFDRNKKRVSLTPAGKTFADGLRRLSKNYAALIEETEAVQSGYSGVIKLAALSGVILHHTMLELLKGFERDYPDIRIDLRTYNLGDFRNLILDYRIDFIYGAIEDFSDNPAFSYQVVCYVKKYIVVPKNHPMANKKIEDLSPADFKEDTFLFSTHQSLAIRTFLSTCQNFGFIPKYTTIADESMLILWVEMGRGITLLDETHMFRGNEDIVLLPLPLLGHTQLGIIHDTGNRKACNMLFLSYVQNANATKQLLPRRC